MYSLFTRVNIYNSTRLQNIEDTEKAKRKLIDETQREENTPRGYEGKKKSCICTVCICFTKLIL